MATSLAQCVRFLVNAIIFALVLVMAPIAALAAPFAAFVMDARTGEVLYQTNADTRLHPASLTKMMTLYIAFQAIERGEISLDTMVTVSKHAASMAPSKLGLKPGQKIALRYLIRAAAIKSANDAATAIGEAIGGSEPAFARRMTRTAKALGMTNSTFKNANGLTASGHLSTAHDMTVLGRHLFYDFPQYYNIFSRRSADAGIAQVASTNRRFLDSYEGADGIKTGYTVPAGFNLTASAQRGNKRIIATILGGKSTAWRNQKMAELLDMGFAKAPNRATVQKPQPPVLTDEPQDNMLMADATDAAPAEDALAAAVAQDVSVDADMNDEANGPAAAKTIRIKLAVENASRPTARPASAAPGSDPAALVASAAAPEANVVADASTVTETSAEPATDEEVAEAAPEPPGPVFEQTVAPQPETVALASPAPEAVTPIDPASADKLAAAVATEGVAVVNPATVEATAPAQAPLALAALPVPTATTPDVTATATATTPQEPAPAAEAPVTADDGGTDIDAAVMMALAEQDGADAGEIAALRPTPRPGSTSAPADDVQLASVDAADIATEQPLEAVLQSPVALAATPGPSAPESSAPEPQIILTEAVEPAPEQQAVEVVTRVSTSGGRQWGITVGRFGSRYEAERVLIQTALVEMNTLDEALRKVVPRGGGFEANFVGMTQDSAELACRRLVARAANCEVIQPTG